MWSAFSLGYLKEIVTLTSNPAYNAITHVFSRGVRYPASNGCLMLGTKHQRFTHLDSTAATHFSDCPLAPPIGGIAERRQQQRHVVVRGFGNAKADRDDVEETRLFRWGAHRIKVGPRVKDQLVGAGFKFVRGQDLLIGAPVVVGCQADQMLSRLPLNPVEINL